MRQGKLASGQGGEGRSRRESYRSMQALRHSWCLQASSAHLTQVEIVVGAGGVQGQGQTGPHGALEHRVVAALRRHQGKEFQARERLPVWLVG